MAFEIISELPELGNYVNEDGISPLHILARKPHAFKSSSYLGSVDLIIYHSTNLYNIILFGHTYIHIYDFFLFILFAYIYIYTL